MNDPASPNPSRPDPASRRPYDVYAKLEDPMGVLSVALGQWERRDDTGPQPQVRRAANEAMTTIDQMLADLRKMRSRLVGEIRATDDAAAARVDALLVGTDALLRDVRRGEGQ